MIGFTLFLLVVTALGYIVLATQDKWKKRKVTIPQPSDVSMQLASSSMAETIEQPRIASATANSHWYRHTFERPRKKGK